MAIGMHYQSDLLAKIKVVEDLTTVFLKASSTLT